MKTPLIAAILALLSVGAIAGPKEDVLAAAAKLAAATSYTWTTTTSIEGAQNAPGVVTGKAEKGGYALVTQERGGNTSVAVIKGDRGVLRTESGWKTAEELRSAAQAGGGGGRGAGMRGGQLLRTAPPASSAAKLAEKAVDLKTVDGAIAGTLPPEAAKDVLSVGRGRPGGQPPEVRNAKGSVKYWLENGALVKMQVTVSGTFAGQNGDRDVNRTSTHEFKNVGTTQVEVPEDAKKKLGT